MSRRKTIAISFGLTVLVAGFAVFWLTRLSPSDCASIEKYDAITGSCYYDCESDEDCARKAKAVDEELNSFFADSQTKVNKESTESDTNGTVYAVTGQLALSPGPIKADQSLWNLFLQVAGRNDAAKYIESFEVFDDANNDTAASVWQSKTPGKWHMNVNAAYENDKKDLLYTMVHEYGHIVSLNSGQVDGQVEGSCPNLQLDEGCSQAGSYINTFNNRFWKPYGAAAPKPGDDNPDKAAAFYAAHRNDFVSEYAATNSVEDWAESWATFVIKTKPNDSTLRDKKVQLFYDYPALVSARDRIRSSIAASL